MIIDYDPTGKTILCPAKLGILIDDEERLTQVAHKTLSLGDLSIDDGKKLKMQLLQSRRNLGDYLTMTRYSIMELLTVLNEAVENNDVIDKRLVDIRNKHFAKYN
jgi:hypothetical protein